MLAAKYFDGKSATAHAVSLTRGKDGWTVCGAGFELSWPTHAATLSERLGRTPRLLTHASGAYCEITDHAGLEAQLAGSGVRRVWLERMQHSLGWAVLAAVLMVAALIAAYRYLLPWGVEQVAMRLPTSVLQQLGSSSLDMLDRLVVQPSTLSRQRQDVLTDAFARLRPLPDTQLSYRVVFRSSPSIGPNAFALPDGSLVVLDQLITLADDDAQVLAVLAHERGHVEHRHALRMALHSSVVGMVLAWYVGDISGLLTTVPAWVAQAHYSRDMEREADLYAERTLRLNALSPCLLATMLGKIEAAHRARSGKQPAASEGEGREPLDYLASHPGTEERAVLLCPAG
jgi:Zn-dependent protease with chaperone function